MQIIDKARNICNKVGIFYLFLFVICRFPKFIYAFCVELDGNFRFITDRYQSPNISLWRKHICKKIVCF